MEVLRVSTKSNPNSPSGIDLVCVPAFADIEIDGEERTAIKLIIESR